MGVREVADRYLLIFYFIGLSSYDPREAQRKSVNWKLRFKLFLPVIARYLLVALLSLITVVYGSKYLGYYPGRVGYFSSSSWFVIEQVTFGVMFWNSIHLHARPAAILKQMQLTELVLRDELNVTVNFAVFEASFKWKLLAYFAGHLPRLLSKCFIASALPPYLQCVYELKEISYLLSIAYVNLYVGLLAAILRAFNDHLERTSNHNFTVEEFACLEPKVAADKLKRCQKVYYRLWKCSNEINCYLGWSLVVLILHLFFFASYSIFRMFLFIKLKFSTSPVGYLRKYQFHLLHLTTIVGPSSLIVMLFLHSIKLDLNSGCC